MPAAHEVSCRNEGRRGAGRNRMTNVTIVPPQHGQRLNAICGSFPIGRGRCGGFDRWVERPTACGRAPGWRSDGHWQGKDVIAKLVVRPGDRVAKSRV